MKRSRYILSVIAVALLLVGLLGSVAIGYGNKSYVTRVTQYRKLQTNIYEFSPREIAGGARINLSGKTALYFHADILSQDGDTVRTNDSLQFVFLRHTPGYDTLLGDDGLAPVVSGAQSDQSVPLWDSVMVSPTMETDTALYYERYITDIDSMWILGLHGPFGVRINHCSGENSAGGFSSAANDSVNFGQTDTIVILMHIEVRECQ